MKKNILSFILGALIFGTCSYTFASYLYRAEDIEFKPTNSEWNATNVNEAIDDLYNKRTPITYSGTLSSGTLTYNGSSHSLAGNSILDVPSGYTKANVIFYGNSLSGTQVTTFSVYKNGIWTNLYSTSTTLNKQAIDITGCEKVRVLLSGTAILSNNEWNHISYSITIY